MPRESSEFWILDWLFKFLPGSSSFPQTLTPHITTNMTSNNDFSPVFDHPSTDSTQTEPCRMSDSYFPSSHRSSFSSNTSSVVAEPGTLRLRPEPPTLRPAQPTRAATTAVSGPSAQQQKVVALDALSRNFPKPTHEPTLEEMLARPPQKWSVGHYVKNAREAKAPVHDKEQQAKAFAEAKRELLAAKEALERSAAAGR
ncbi:hypothetical protein CONLIGDRAFT_165860 [Coniochaeta ligniaria NRRL 30616]|uniref:Uncharacterized protein n=1 Tax=Coniochaeta ligniaria NRRL 30616 TaxID=1408157 RepID=A0A1J7JTC4_9PEZI|nr:hypothetical protein CONLIGDRAFT_165860 [Coniochaeta ligniaria NRRL 30616]